MQAFLEILNEKIGARAKEEQEEVLKRLLEIYQNLKGDKRQ